MADVQDATLVQACLQGDLNAFERLVDRYQKPVYNVALKMLRNAEDAEDVTQSIFLRAFEVLDRYNPQHSFFSWIYRMTINESINQLKRRRRHIPVDTRLSDPAAITDGQADADSLTEQIETALMRLKPESRALVVLRYFHSCSYAELAYIMNIPEKTVKSRLFTARHQLKDILSKEGVLHA